MQFSKGQSHEIFASVFVRIVTSVGDLDPDPKDPHDFAGSGSVIFSTDPDQDEDLNLAHFHHPSTSP